MNKTTITVTGTIIRISDLISSKNFQKRDIVLEFEDDGSDGKTYKEVATFSAINSTAELIYGFGIKSGDIVTIEAKLKGKDKTVKNHDGDTKQINFFDLKIVRIAPHQN